MYSCFLFFIFFPVEHNKDNGNNFLYNPIRCCSHQIVFENGVCLFYSDYYTMTPIPIGNAGTLTVILRPTKPSTIVWQVVSCQKPKLEN